ncbi:hypothetical protein [Streptomyces microflavus]|uniref:hypothetical protein n=1 Tax=Streptomyces microflavus TaxID=1919 RepID=UPI0036A9FAB8
MAVIGVLTEPTPPTWWKANRHKAFGALGLLLGFMLCDQTHDSSERYERPRPSHTAPTSTPGPHPAP